MENVLYYQKSSFRKDPDMTITPAQRTGMLLTLLAAAFLTSMSTTVTGTMIPNFTTYFGISSGLAQWLTSGASLIAGITMPVTSCVMKRMSNKIYFLMAMTAFTAGSLTAVFSVSFTVLLLSRLLQAIGCGMLLPFIQTVLLQLYPKERHGSIMGAYAMSSMVSAVIGPTYAGFLLDAFGWKGVFVSLCISGGLIVVCGVLFVKAVTVPEAVRIPIPDVLLSSAGFAAFLFGISNLNGSLLSLKSGGCLLIGVLLLSIFVLLQLHSESPMLHLQIFCHAPFRIAVILNLCMYLITMGNAMILPIFTKSIRQFSDSVYGLATLTGSVLSVFAAILAGKLYDKTGIRPMLLSGTVLFAACSVMGCRFTHNTSIFSVAFVFALQSVAVAVLNAPATAMALSGFEGQERIDGSAVYNTLRQIASALGSVLSVQIFTLLGGDLNAVRGVYLCFGLITAAIAAVMLCLRKEISPLQKKIQKSI